MEVGGAPYFYPFPLPYVYPTHPNAGLVLTGYRFTMQNIVDFQAYFSDINSTALTIKVHPYQDILIHKLAFYILLLNPSSDWVWVMNGCSSGIK